MKLETVRVRVFGCPENASFTPIPNATLPQEIRPWRNRRDRPVDKIGALNKPLDMSWQRQAIGRLDILWFRCSGRITSWHTQRTSFSGDMSWRTGWFSISSIYNYHYVSRDDDYSYYDWSYYRITIAVINMLFSIQDRLAGHPWSLNTRSLRNSNERGLKDICFSFSFWGRLEKYSFGRAVQMPSRPTPSSNVTPPQK